MVTKLHYFHPSFPVVMEVFLSPFSTQRSVSCDVIESGRNG